LFVRGAEGRSAEGVNQAVQIVRGDIGQRNRRRSGVGGGPKVCDGADLVQCDAEGLGAISGGNVFFGRKNQLEVINGLSTEGGESRQHLVGGVDVVVIY
jgi:hypothetical protein